MKISILVLFLISMASTDPVREYIIDLDLPAGQRYMKIISEHSDSILKLYNTAIELFDKTVQMAIENVFKKITIIKYKDYAEEIIGIARLLNLPPEKIFMLNCIYEIMASCTSIVTRDSRNKILLARNLDYGFTEIFRKIHVGMIYIKNGNELFRCAGLAGSIGTITCMKKNSYALSINARRLNNTSAMIKKLQDGRSLIPWIVRDAFMKFDKFEDIAKYMHDMGAASGCYVTIAGMGENQGTIITRGRDGAIDKRVLSNSAWYIAQCNTDHWAAKDERTKFVNEGMIKLGKENVSLKRMNDDLLQKVPLLRKTTVATILMSPVDGTFEIIPATYKIQNN